jgi:AcrR family transcriptional regulator
MVIDKSAVDSTISRMPRVKMRRSKASRSNVKPLHREAWVQAARSALIKGGVQRVKIEPLAATLGVTTGSFYWHFKNRTELHEALIADWRQQNSSAMYDAVAANPDDPERAMDTLADIYILEQGYSPAWDAAMRDWARTSAVVERAVRQVDEQRIELWRGIFKKLGYEDHAAFMRARLTYFHQVGYYSLRIAETQADRLRLKQAYIDILIGPKASNRAERLRD